MAKKTVKNIDVKGKRVFVRVDFNVPLDENLKITDDLRIVESLPTIKYLMGQNAKIILASHLGRPKGEKNPKMSLKPVAGRLSELLNEPVKFAPDCIGPEVTKMCEELKPGEVILLENLRFYKEEEKNDEGFCKKLAELAEIYVNDAFGTAHRAHSSTQGITKFIKTCVAGFLIEKELKYLGEALEKPDRPLLAILGGAKVSTKIGVIENLLNKVDILLIGGGMTFTFLKAQDLEIGKSLLEEETVPEAKKLLEKFKTAKAKVLLSVDSLIADKFEEGANTKVVSVDNIPAGWQGVDIGPETLELFESEIKKARTIIWNGPVGVFEIDKFASGTKKIAELLANSSAITIIGGGDTAAAVSNFGFGDKMTHISTGGGASLEFLEGIVLPGIDALNNA